MSAPTDKPSAFLGESLSQSLANLEPSDIGETNSNCDSLFSSGSSNSLTDPRFLCRNGSSPEKQDVESFPSLNDYDIWANYGLSKGGNSSVSDLQSWGGSYFPSFDYSNGYDGTHQKDNLSLYQTACNTSLNPGSSAVHRAPRANPLTGNSDGLSSPIVQCIINMGIDGLQAFSSQRSQKIRMIVALDQAGSQYLQDLLSLKEPRITDQVLQGVSDFMIELMSNKHGHYLFGKLIESCNEDQIKLVILNVASKYQLFVDAPISRYGSLSVAKLIRLLKTSPLIIQLIPIVCNKFYEMITNQAGSFVILKCLEILDTKTNESFYKALMQHALELASDDHGCRVLNKAMEWIKGPSRQELLDLISSNAVFLAQDPYGNYVLQNVLGFHYPLVNEKICSCLKGHYVSISFTRQGSYVTEKCLKTCGRNHVLEELSESKELTRLARDQYGNYVVQAAINTSKVVSIPHYEKLVKNLQMNLNAINRGNGKNIVRLIGVLDEKV